MSKNKEEIRYILLEKRKNAMQAVKKICDIYGHVQYQYVWHKAGSSLLNLEIFM